jgi:DNA-binding CsgD family transcriptional regulator
MLGELSHFELVRLMELANRCLAVRTYDDLDAVLSDLGAVLSFRGAAMCAVDCTAAGPSLDHIVNHSFGEPWAGLYTRREFHRVDPVLLHAARRTGAFTWDDAFRHGVIPRDCAFLEAARDFGLVDGATSSCGSERSASSRTLLSVSGLEPRWTARTLNILTGAGPHLHEAYRRLLAQDAPEPGAAPLSAREKEILEWAKQGKTYWEIGCILGISQRTVKYHFASIKAKLDVVSRCHAVAKAMRQGLIA